MADSTDNIKKFREILELEPGSRVFTLLAEELCAAGKWEEAAKICRKGLLTHPDLLRARMLFGWALMEMGESEEAESLLAKAVEEVRRNGEIFRRLSELAAKAGKTESAAEYSRIGGALGDTEPSGSGAETSEAESVETEGLGAEGFDTDNLEADSLETEGLVADSLVAESLEAEGLETEGAPAKEVSEWDEFKSEAIEHLDTEVADVLLDAEISDILQEFPEALKIGFEDILERFARSFEERLTNTSEPAAILSENDRDMLKERIIAFLGA